VHPAVVLHIPHSSSLIPAEDRSGLLLSDCDLHQELLAMTDWFTDELFDLPGATRIVFPISRLVVDPERFLDDSLETMAGRGMGVIYTRTSGGNILRAQPSTELRMAFINRYYDPHHNALAIAVGRVLDIHSTCLLIDCHSFPARPLPYEFDQSPERADICLGTDGFHTPPRLITAAVDAFQQLGFTVSINRPFSGTLLPLKHYQQESRVFSLMVEVNRGLYLDEATGERNENYSALQSKIQAAMTAIATACSTSH